MGKQNKTFVSKMCFYAGIAPGTAFSQIHVVTCFLCVWFHDSNVYMTRIACLYVLSREQRRYRQIPIHVALVDAINMFMLCLSVSYVSCGNHSVFDVVYSAIAPAPAKSKSHHEPAPSSPWSLTSLLVLTMLICVCVVWQPLAFVIC